VGDHLGILGAVLFIGLPNAVGMFAFCIPAVSVPVPAVVSVMIVTRVVSELGLFTGSLRLIDKRISSAPCIDHSSWFLRVMESINASALG
jgi:hypothetical protein